MPTPPNLPGGQLYMEYRHLPSGERHSLRIHLAYFDPTPIDETNNRAYTSDGPVVPTDATIVDSYNSFAALWQQYYNSDWQLRCIALLQYNSFTEVVLTPTPSYPVHTGTDTTELTGKLYFERKFKLLSKTGSRRELVLAQVIDTTLRPHAFYVGASSGGVDARDQALMAYFSGASGTGFVMPDGNYAFSDTEMSVWWNKQPEGGVDGGVLTGDCLLFPEGPSVCAPDEGTINFNVHTIGDPPEIGSVQHALDVVGLLLASGIKLAAFGSQFELNDNGGIHYVTHDGFQFVVQAQPSGVDASNTTARRVIDADYYNSFFRADGVEQLHLPITVETDDTNAAMMLVREATAPSPFWIPYNGFIKPVGDAPVPTGSTDTEARCGAAWAMTHELFVAFNRVVSAARALIGLGTGLTAPTIAEALITVFLGPEVIVSALVMAALKFFINYVIDSAISDTIGSLDGAQEIALAHSCFCSLSVSGGNVVIDAPSIAAWRTSIPSYVTATVGQLDALDLIFPSWTLEAWRRWGYLGASQPSGDCGGFTCP